MNNCEYVQEYYGVPACIGRRIRYKSKLTGVEEGVIFEDGGNYISVNLDKDKPGLTINIHPTDPNLEYLGMGKVREMTRGQRKYQEYLAADYYDEGFASWLGIKTS